MEPKSNRLGLAAGGVYASLTRTRSSFADRVAAILLLAVGLALVSTSLVSYWNVHGQQDEDQKLVLPVLDERTSPRRGKSDYLYVRWSERSERLRVDSVLYDPVRVGGGVAVDVAPGALDHPHVTRFLGVHH